MKCKRSYPDADVKVCSFNASHHVPTKDLKEHERNCPDAMRFLSYQMKYEVRIISKPPVAPAVDVYKRIHGDDDEDWDAEATIKESYNPYKMTASKQVLRKIEGATESERREFRDQEKRRLDDLNKKSEVIKENRNGLLLQRVRNSQVSMKVEVQNQATYDSAENPSQSNVMGKFRGRGRKIPHAPIKETDKASAVGAMSRPEPPQQGKSRGRGRLVWGSRD